MSSPDDYLDDALCHMLGLPNRDQLLLPFWKASLLITADNSGWITGEVKLYLQARGEGTVTSPDQKAA